MNPQLVLGTGARSIVQHTAAPVQLSRSFSSRSKTLDRNGKGNVSSIAEWLASFNDNVETVPSSILKFKHDPSTKGRSRASLKVICQAPIDKLGNHVPAKVLQKVQASTHYLRRTDAIVTTSGKRPSTTGNQEECIKKLYDIIREITKAIITEECREPPRPLPNRPPCKISTNEARNRFHEQKRLRRKAKSNEKLARAREEAKKARGTRH